MDNFGHRVKALRKENGWTQDELAQKCGLTMSCICKWERNQREAAYEDKMKLANIFNVDVEYINCETDVRRTPAQNVSYSPEVHLLASLASRLSTKQLESLMEYGKFLEASK